jgi:hypothetical protein
MKRYRLIHPAFIDGDYRFAGEIVALPDSAQPNSSMEPVDEGVRPIRGR